MHCGSDPLQHVSRYETVLTLKDDAPTPQGLADNPYMKSWLKADARIKADECARRYQREFQAAQAVLLNKRFVAGFQKIS